MEDYFSEGISISASTISAAVSGFEIPDSNLSDLSSPCFCLVPCIPSSQFPSAKSSLTLADYCTIAYVAFSPAMFVAADCHGLPSAILYFTTLAVWSEVVMAGFYHSGHH